MANKIFLFVLFVFFNLLSHAQTWELTNADLVEEKGIRDLQPSKFALYELDDNQMKSLLWQAPAEAEVDVYDSKTVIQVGLPDGTTEKFKVVSYVMMEKGLAERYPDFKTFYGVSATNDHKGIRIDYTSQGFRAVISAPDQDKIFIDHYQRGDKNTRIVYYKKEYRITPGWRCQMQETNFDRHPNSGTGKRIGNCELITYRLAQATTGAYSTYHGAANSSQSGLVLAAVITVINRSNEVYEADLGVRMILIANTDQVFYYGAGGGGYPNNGTSADLSTNQTNCTNVIGTANFDIGHVFGTGDGGIAGLGVVCNNSRKAEGYTGRPNPVGDPFTIDYVVHEVGHQFNANHTQNNNCNRNNSTAMEPGSASTIMGYAGICSPNVQNNSDAYYHAISLQEIKTYTATGTGSTCETNVSSFVNTAPVVTAQPNYTIPASTPFSLTLQATDAQNHAMTYCWDQMNNTVATMPPVATNTGGPTFRSVSPSTNPTRFFPNLASILTGANTNTWEVLPSNARTMNFRGVVRDWTGVAGCNSEINLTVSTVASTGPFRVTGLDVATTWLEGDPRMITWDVAGSTANGINTANVSILMSYDGGNTFPVTLIASTPNDGSQLIVVPNGLTTTARIMVRGIGNVFFDINNANITVNTGVPSFAILPSVSSINVCVGTQNSLNLDVFSILGFTNAVNLSVTGLPSGMTANLGSTTLIPGQTTILTLINASAALGSNSIQVVGTSGSITKSATISVISQSSTPATLTAPANNATNVSIRPNITWSAVSGVTSYGLQVSRDPLFSVMAINNTVSATNFQVVNLLDGLSEYYWRINTGLGCSAQIFSPVFKFETEPCFEYNSTNVPVTIPTTASTINSTLNISDKGTITDLDVLRLTGLHTFVDDLIFTLFAPSTTSVLIWNRPCTSQDNFNINFDQASALANTWPCPPTNGLTYQPSSPSTLNTYNGQALRGLWRMQVQDVKNNDGGSLQTWGLKTCATSFCRLNVNNTFQKGAGSLFAAVNCASAGDTIRIASSLVNDTIFLDSEFLNINKNIFIEGDITKNIHIMSTSSTATIVNTAPNTADGLKIKGLHIHSSNNNIGAIQNQGKLTLEDVYLYKFPGASTATIDNSIGASVELIGNCRIIQN